MPASERLDLLHLGTADAGQVRDLVQPYTAHLLLLFPIIGGQDRLIGEVLCTGHQLDQVRLVQALASLQHNDFIKLAAIRSGAPKFGFKPDSKVTQLRYQ